MTFLLQNLIDKRDNFEIVRDQIAQLLVDEATNQMNLAAAAAKDPEEWRLNVFLERSQPWSMWEEAPLPGTPEAAPLVNVWYDGGSFAGDSGDTVRTQKHRATYNVDVYGYGVSADVATGGQEISDKQASINCQRGVRLVRNILMASSNMWLQLPDMESKPRLVSRRWVSSIRTFQPQINQPSIQAILASRVSFVVDFLETSPQYEGQPCEAVVIDINLKEDGSVVSTVEIDF